MFFFAKKNQKTFVSLARAGSEVRDSEASVFCFFFSKKKALSFFGIAVLGTILALTTPWHAAFWGGDAARHALNGALIHDWIAAGDWRHPMAFATQYYLHYPAITIALYPPLVPVLEAAAYALGGVNEPAAQAVILGFVFLALGGIYAVARIALPQWQSLAACCLLLAMPMFAHLARQVMLEIPSAALALAGSACLLRFLRGGHSRLLWGGTLLSVAAGYAKQSAAFGLAAWPLIFLWEQRGAALRDARLYRAALLGGAGLVPLVAYTWVFGRWSMGTIVEGAARDAATGPLFYLQSLPELAGWTTLLLAAGAVAVAPFARPRADEALLLRWGVVWSVVNLALSTAVAHKEARYALVSTLPFPVLATVFASRIGAMVARRPAACSMAVGVGALAWGLVSRPASRVEGYPAVAQAIAAMARPNEIVMFQGLRVHDFAFSLRQAEKLPLDGPIVLRPVKFLVRYMGERPLGATDRHLSSADILALIDRFCVRLIVLQPGFWADLPSMAAFESTVRDRFRLVRRLPISGDLDPGESAAIEVYERVVQADCSAARIDFDMPMLGGRLAQ